MEFARKVAEQVARLPTPLRQVLDAELAAGREVTVLEFGRGPDGGKAALVLRHPFRSKAGDAPSGVLYRERLDGDPHVFEFYVPDESFSLITAKFKPMKLQPLGPGPENPTAAHVERMKQRVRVEAGLHSSDPNVRREVRKDAGGKEDPAERERHLVRSLERDVLFGGLSQAIDEAQTFHPPAVMDALFRAALFRDGEAAVHLAALLFFLHGKAKEPFDWDHRPFFLTFHATDRAEREQRFRELCATVGVNPAKYLR